LYVRNRATGSFCADMHFKALGGLLQRRLILAFVFGACLKPSVAENLLRDPYRSPAKKKHREGWGPSFDSVVLNRA
jgi:hypothetical protein